MQGAVTDLTHNAQLIEATALRDINMTIDQMTRVAAGVGPDVQRRALKEVDVALRTFHRVDPMFIELDVVDAAGRLVVTTSRRGRRAPLSRIAIAFALEGKRFVSGPTPFPELNKSLFVIAVPVPETTYEAVRDEFECRAMPEATPKGTTKTPRLLAKRPEPRPLAGGGRGRRGRPCARRRRSARGDRTPARCLPASGPSPPRDGGSVKRGGGRPR